MKLSGNVLNGTKNKFFGSNLDHCLDYVDPGCTR